VILILSIRLCVPRRLLTSGNEVMTGESNRMARPSPYFSLRDCDNPISTIGERPEHAASIGTHWQPEMHFKCLARNCALGAVNPAGQPESDFASV
jgi:hypothetical protein